MLESDTLRTRDGRQRTDLIRDDVFDVARRERHLPPAEARHIGKGRMGPDGDSMLPCQRHRRMHDTRVASMKAAGDIGGGDVGYQGWIFTGSINRRSLADVSVQINAHVKA